MAARFDASGDSLSATDGSLPAITNFTAMCWAYVSASTGGFRNFITFGSSNFYSIASNNSNVLGMWNTSSVATGSGITAATWYHVAISVAGTGAGQFLGYRNGVLDITHNGSTNPTTSKLTLGNSPSSDWLNGRVAAFKFYDAVLTAAEIAAEMRQYMPIRWTNLNRWCPLRNAAEVYDYAKARNLTVGGALTTEDGPPIPWRRRPMNRKPGSRIGDNPSRFMLLNVGGP